MVIPQLREAIKIKSKALSPEYVLYLPPHSSVHLLLSYKPDRPERFRGRVVYDPLEPRADFAGVKTLEEAKQACIFSNMIEYEVTAGDKK